MVQAKVVNSKDFWDLSPGEAGLIVDGILEQNEAQEKLYSQKNEPTLSSEQIKHLDKRRAKLRAKGMTVL